MLSSLQSMNNKDLKRKTRSPTSNNAFAAPRAKKQRTKSPISRSPNNRHVRDRASIHENKYNVSFCYVYDIDGIIPKKDVLKAKRIEVRIPISVLSFKSNPNVNRRHLWGGGAINSNLYSSDSDPVCILYHSGILTKYALNTDLGFDPFSILNLNLSLNFNGNKASNVNDYDYMYVRTSKHKLTPAEIEHEQKRRLTRTKLDKILGNRDMIGIGVIFDVTSPNSEFHSVNNNGYYSRKWLNKDNEIPASFRLKYVYPLTDCNQFVIDSKFLYSMKRMEGFKMPTENEEAMQSEYAKLIREMDVIGLQLNYQHKQCLKYNTEILSNVHWLINHNECTHHLNNNGDRDEINQNEKRYGHLLQYRLQRYILMMENDKCQYQLVLNTKSNQIKKYKLIQIQFVNNTNHVVNQRKQRHHNRIADDLNWNDLKWSNRGLSVRGKLYPIHKVWLIKK